jgi:hypothetical protein
MQALLAVTVTTSLLLMLGLKVFSLKLRGLWAGWQETLQIFGAVTLFTGANATAAIGISLVWQVALHQRRSLSGVVDASTLILSLLQAMVWCAWLRSGRS